ncbi:transcriptional coactivator/pterin dehydratase [Amniculicola lignicola CBS 123094]|uniref:4a-hydroxytetrahydrobiopterin dehydratase n=1 Tax=Amniculicola lignicola CBS 123094 TaxID=1392246 RepID=A0A6A5WKU7_9PLEO|nr:transcriptional coactivator/pterin dehydratase [Amniculicola lignicola CBS 123094]
MTPKANLLRSCAPLIRLQRSTQARYSFNQVTKMSASNDASLQPQIAEGENEVQVRTDLEVLAADGWRFNLEQIQLEKTYNFKTYTKVLDMHTSIGIGSKAKNHHPTMATDAGSLTVFWTTHYPRGLTAKDTFMAKYCDEQAKLIGTVDKSDAMKCKPSDK